MKVNKYIHSYIFSKILSSNFITLLKNNRDGKYLIQYFNNIITKRLSYINIFRYIKYEVKIRTFVSQK